jgi:hypothetical protein
VAEISTLAELKNNAAVPSFDWTNCDLYCACARAVSAWWAVFRFVNRQPIPDDRQ